MEEQTYKNVKLLLKKTYQCSTSPRVYLERNLRIIYRKEK
jgi:hypothetical protein